MQQRRCIACRFLAAVAFLAAGAMLPRAAPAQNADDGFDPDANGGVTAIAVQPDGRILIGGGFTTLAAGTVTRRHIARLKVDGSVDATFDPDADDGSPRLRRWPMAGS